MFITAGWIERRCPKVVREKAICAMKQKWEPNSHSMAKFLLVPPANGQNLKGPFNAQLLGRFVNDVWKLQEPNVIISVTIKSTHTLSCVYRTFSTSLAIRD